MFCDHFEIQYWIEPLRAPQERARKLLGMLKLHSYKFCTKARFRSPVFATAT